MPLYLYHCKDCHKEFEKILTVQKSSIENSIPCPDCNSVNTAKAFTSAPLVHVGRKLKMSGKETRPNW